MGDSFASILDAAGTNCFYVRLGAGDRKPKGVCPRTAGEPLTVACDACVVGVLGRSGAGVALSLAVLNRLPDPTTAGATAVNLDFFRPPPARALHALPQSRRRSRARASAVPIPPIPLPRALLPIHARPYLSRRSRARFPSRPSHVRRERALASSRRRLRHRSSSAFGIRRLRRVLRRRFRRSLAHRARVDVGDGAVHRARVRVGLARRALGNRRESSGDWANGRLGERPYTRVFPPHDGGFRV